MIGGQTSVRTRQARRRRRKVRGVVVLTAVFLAVMAALAWYLSARNDNSIVAAVETTEPPGLGAGDDPTKAGPGTEADTTDRSAPETTALAPIEATTTEPAAPTTAADASSSTSTTTPTTATTRARRTSTTAAPTSTTPPETSAPTTAAPTSTPSTTAEPTTTTEGTTTTVASLTSGTPTPVGVQVTSGGGRPLEGIQVFFEVRTPASPEATSQSVVTDGNGFAELTLLSGCYSIDFDEGDELENQRPKRRCFKPVGTRHLVTIVADTSEHKAPSRCSVEPTEDGVLWTLNIYQFDGVFAPAYRAVGQAGSELVIRDQVPVATTENARTYDVEWSVFENAGSVQLVALHAAGSSAPISCQMVRSPV